MFSHRVVGAFATLLVIGIALAQPNQKQALPDDAAQAKAEKQIRDIFKEDYAKTKPADLKALSAKLLKQARETKDDQAARYVLFREAADLSARAGDALTAIQVVGEWAGAFAIDERVVKAEVLLTANKSAGSNADLKNVAEAALNAAEDAVTKDDYPTAVRLIDAAHDAAKHGSHAALDKQILVRREDLVAMGKEYPAVKEALTTLATKPEDADACRLAGKFFCFWKGDWENGLPYLTNGFDDRTRALARKDRANPREPAEMVELADGWWDIAETLQGGARLNVLRRALEWYQSAVPGLSGLNRTKVEQRIKAAAEMLPEEPVGEIREMVGHQGKVYGVAFAPNGLWGASGGDDRVVRLWDVATGKEIRRFVGHGGLISNLAFSADGKRIVSAGDSTLRVWDVDTGKEARPAIDTSSNAAHAYFTPDGRRLVSVQWLQDKDSVRLWDIETGKEIRRYGTGANAYALAMSHDGTRVMAGGWDRLLIVWDLESGRELRRMAGSPNHIHTCAFSPNEKLAASSGKGKGEIHLWDLENGRHLRRLDGHSQFVGSVVFSPNGRYLLSACRDGTLRLWNVATGNETLRLKAKSNTAFERAVFSPDGRRVLSAGDDGVVRLWAVPK